MEPYRERIEDFMRRWRSRYEGDRVFRVLVITVVIAAVGVTMVSLQQPPTYEASAQVLVGRQQEGPWQTLEYRELPIQMMIAAIDNRPVAEDVIQRLGLRMEPAELLDSLSVEQVQGTSFLLLTYESTAPYKTQQIVNTVGEVSSELISERSNQLTATVWEKAAVPESPVSPRPLRNGLLALVIGLMLCAGTVVALPGVGARAAGTLGEQPSRQGIDQARVLGRDRNIVERVKEKELLLALGRRGKLTAVEAALETSLSVEEAQRMLQALALQGHIQATVEHGRLLYALWEHDAPL